MKILDFKTVSPLFEMERDGVKPFTERLIDLNDPRFWALSQWVPERKWIIRITNPNTGESFMRRIKSVSWLYLRDNSEKDYELRHKILFNWRVILFGEKVK